MQYLLVFTSIFLLFIIILLTSFFSLEIGNVVLYIFMYIFVFLIWFIIWEIRKDFVIWDFLFKWKNVFKYIVILLYIFIAYKFSDFNLMLEIIIWYILFCLLFFIDSRISFLIALSLLSFVPVFLIMWDNSKAETLSIYTYYFLIIWVFMSIYENIINKNLDNNFIKNEV